MALQTGMNHVFQSIHSLGVNKNFLILRLFIIIAITRDTSKLVHASKMWISGKRLSAKIH